MKRTENRSANFDLQIRKAKTCFELLNLAEKGQNKSFGRAKDYVWLLIPPVCFIGIVGCSILFYFCSNEVFRKI